MYRKPYLLLIIALLISACTTTETIQNDVFATKKIPDAQAQCFDLSVMSAEDQEYARDILWEVLDEVGLYTVVDTLKAMSDVKSHRFPAMDEDQFSTDAPDSLKLTPSDRQELRQLKRVVANLHCGPVSFTVTPFQSLYGGKRYYQLRVVNLDILNKQLAKNNIFWERWGFVPGSNPSTIITVMEYESGSDRFRGYGLLYGYPDYAVDFFVDAANEQKKTGEFVQRDFFQIPAYSGDTGRYVYAMPKGHTPTEVDSVIYRRAVETLARYRELRDNQTYEHPEKLIREWLSN